MRYGQFAADRSNVDDRGAARACERLLRAHVRQCGPGGVERGEEIDMHGPLEGFGGLRFDGADFDDAGVVDQDIDAPEAGDGFSDEAAALGGLGEVGSDEVEVVRGEVRVVFNELGLRLLQVCEVARRQHQPDGLSRKTVGDGEAEAAGATRDEHDSTGCERFTPQRADGGGCEECGANGGHSGSRYSDCGGGQENGLERSEQDTHERIGCTERAGGGILNTMATKRKSKGAYMISSVAEMYAIHPQTLRLYEREGLLRPSRSDGNTRLYTDEDLERLEFILNLARDLGVNIAGIAIILQMRERMEEMNRQMQGFVDFVRTEMLTRMQQAEPKAGLVPLRRPLRPNTRDSGKS